MKLCRVCVDPRCLSPNFVEGVLLSVSCDGRRSREILTPGSACNLSLDGDGLTARGGVEVGRGILEVKRGIPLGGRTDVLLRSITAVCSGDTPERRF